MVGVGGLFFVGCGRPLALAFFAEREGGERGEGERDREGGREGGRQGGRERRGGNEGERERERQHGQDDPL